MLRPCTLWNLRPSIFGALAHDAAAATRRASLSVNDGRIDPSQVQHWQIRTSHPALEAWTEAAPGGGVRLAVRFEPEEPGAFHQRVLIETGDSASPQLVIPVHATVLGDVTVTPRHHYLGALRDQNSVVLRLSVQINDPSHRVETIQSLRGGFAVQPVDWGEPAGDEGRAVDVRIEFLRTGLIDDALVIQTTGVPEKVYVGVVAHVE